MLKKIVTIAVLFCWCAPPSRAQTLDQAEMKAMAENIAEGLTNGNPAPFNEAFNMERFEARIFAYIESKLGDEVAKSDDYKQFKSEFFLGFNQELDRNPIGNQLVNSYKVNQNKLSFLRILTRKNEPYVILRVAENQMVNYMELFYGFDNQGKLCVVDTLSHASGISLSKIMGNTAITTYHSTKGMVNKLLGKDEAFVNGLEILGDIQMAAQKGDLEKASALIDEAKTSVKNLEIFMVMALGIKARIGDQSFVDLVDHYKTVFPGHPALNVNGILAESLRGNIDNAFKAVDAMDESVGGDPFMNVIRAGLWIQKGDLDQAEKAYRSALVVPHAEDSVYWGLVSLSLIKEDFVETVTHLKRLETLLNLDFSLDALAKTDPYIEFGKSEAFTKWREEKELTE